MNRFRYFKIIDVNDKQYNDNCIYKLALYDTPHRLSKKLYNTLLKTNDVITSFTIIETTRRRKKKDFIIKFKCTQMNRTHLRNDKTHSKL